MKQTTKNRISFILELILVIAVTSIAIIYNMRDLMFAPNDYYPVTSDAMGHMAKVAYIAKCFSEFKIPSWFPFWYNGATVMQYYPPLSYLIMAPIQMITNNAMITFKVFCFLSVFIGSMGVWAFCRKFFGKWCGILGAAVYGIEPFMYTSIVVLGVLAQGPIFMLSPWIILAISNYAIKPTKTLWAVICALTPFLILSHAMHAYMVIVCVMAILFIFVLANRVELKTFILLIFSIGLGAMTTAVWAIQGSTNLENPTIPYLLEEAAMNYTATANWFNGVHLRGEGKYHNMYFDPILLGTCIIAFAVLLALDIHKKKNPLKSYPYGVYNILLFFFTILFSFGRYVPGFSIIPLYKSLVPGRILSLSAVCASIVCGYFIYRLSTAWKNRILSVGLAIIMSCVIIVGINPSRQHSLVEPLNEKYKERISEFNDSGEYFNKGRYGWVGAVPCAETYFPMLYGYNMTDGWNIEGTPHNTTIWMQNIAIEANCEDSIIKNQLRWNVSALLVDRNYGNLINSLIKWQGYKPVKVEGGYQLLKNDNNSSYFFEDPRNAIVIGNGGDGVAMEFPWIVRGTMPNIDFYDINELIKYKVVYFNEPILKTLSEIKSFEDTVRSLVKNGVKVIIETNANQIYPVFGVGSYDFNMEDDMYLNLHEESGFNGDLKSFKFKNEGITRGYTGLDNVFYSLDKQNSTLKNDIIGEKYIDGGKVTFVGMVISQYMEASQIKRKGYHGEIDDYNYYKPISKLIRDLVTWEGEVYQSISVQKFPVTSSNWDYDGGEFEYTADKDTQITVSITYTPRWKVTVDGNEIGTTNKENLLSINLPQGTHKVNIHYGMTIYGKISLVITCGAILAALLFLMLYKKISQLIVSIIEGIARVLDIK